MLLTLILALTALVLWINSRGIFIYLDNVATGRSDVARPWREHADLAGSLFAWRFGLVAATLVSLLTLVLLGVLLVYSVQKGGIESGVGLGVALLLLLPGFLPAPVRCRAAVSRAARLRRPVAARAERSPAARLSGSSAFC